MKRLELKIKRFAMFDEGNAVMRWILACQFCQGGYSSAPSLRLRRVGMPVATKPCSTNNAF